MSYLLALDVGRHTAPREGEAAWGSPDEFPAASFFLQGYLNQDGDSEIGRNLTQQCFNPLSIGLKKAALELSGGLAEIHSGRVALGVFPGSGRALDIVRNVDNGPTESEPYNSERAADPFCRAISRPPEFPRYRMPPVEGILPESGDLWSRATHQEEHGDHAEVLARARGVLRAARSERGGKHVLIIAGDLPRVGDGRFPHENVRRALRREFEAISAEESNGSGRRLAITWIVLINDNAANVTSEEIASFERFLKDSEGGISGAGLSLSINLARSEHELLEWIVPQLLVGEKFKVIAG
jgi:hypothetical protein